MRQLKFRVWDKRWKKFIVGDLFFEQINYEGFEVASYEDDDGNLHELKYSQRKLDSYHGYVVQQYTGLKDKNGVEIYEGDIVTYTSINGKDYKAEIVFSPTLAAFVLDTSRRHLLDDKYGDYYELHKDHSYEVVGNIFKNSEILEK